MDCLIKCMSYFNYLTYFFACMLHTHKLPPTLRPEGPLSANERAHHKLERGFHKDVTLFSCKTNLIFSKVLRINSKSFLPPPLPLAKLYLHFFANAMFGSYHNWKLTEFWCNNSIFTWSTFNLTNFRILIFVFISWME